LNIYNKYIKNKTIIYIQKQKMSKNIPLPYTMDNEQYGLINNINTREIKNNYNLNITADYSLKLDEKIGNRPIVSPRFYEKEIPSVLTSKNINNNLNYNCCAHNYNKNNKCI
jgi:hypothetical protein